MSRQALTFRKSDPQLRREADAALAKLRQDGTLKRISTKYFGADVSVPEKADLEVKASDSVRSTSQVHLDTAGPMARVVVKGTIPLTFIRFAFGLVIALGAALAQMSDSRWLRASSPLLRLTPLLVQLFIVFYGLPQVGIKLSGFVAACLALSLNVGGYAAEVIRASILSVPRGQFEAATTIGMGFAQSLRRIVLPQALRIAVTPAVQHAAVVGQGHLPGVRRAGHRAVPRGAEGRVGQRQVPRALLLAALYFWIICFVLSLVPRRLEKRLERFAA